jgi:hydroxypyruvate isomerase
MLGNLLGGLIDTEQIVHDTIQSTLENVAEELNCTHKELFIMIKPIDESFTMKFYIYKIEQSPKLIREITLKEILGSD